MNAIGGLLIDLFTKAAQGRPDLFRPPRFDVEERSGLAGYVSELLERPAENSSWRRGPE